MSSVACQALFAPAMFNACTSLVLVVFVPVSSASVPPLMFRFCIAMLDVTSLPAPALVRLIEPAFSAMIVGTVSVEVPG